MEPPRPPSASELRTFSFHTSQTRPRTAAAPSLPHSSRQSVKPTLALTPTQLPRLQEPGTELATRLTLKAGDSFSLAPAPLHLPFFSPVSRNEADKRRTQWTRGAESSSVECPMSPLTRQGWNRETDACFSDNQRRYSSIRSLNRVPRSHGATCWDTEMLPLCLCACLPSQTTAGQAEHGERQFRAQSRGLWQG